MRNKSSYFDLPKKKGKTLSEFSLPLGLGPPRGGEISEIGGKRRSEKLVGKGFPAISSFYSYESNRLGRRNEMRILWMLLILGSTTVSAFGQATAAGQCDSCQANEASATVTYVVGPGDYVYENDPGCDSDTNTAINQLVQAYANSQVPGISVFAGPFLTNVSSQLGNAIKQNVGGSLGDWLQVFTGQRTANCAVMALAIPAGSRYTGYRYEAREQGAGWNKCPTGNTDCPIGWSAYREAPNVRWTRNGGLAMATFKNWSGDRTREARFTVYFVPPTNTWAPPR